MALPKGMIKKESCDVCFKEMERANSFLRPNESAVEVWYKCKCGYEIGFAYFNGFIEAYKQQKDYPGQPSAEITAPTEGTPEIHGEKQ